jgi:hypothetical protein
MKSEGVDIPDATGHWLEGEDVVREDDDRQ